MPKKFTKLNETFNIEGTTVEKEIIETPEEKIEKLASVVTDIKKDYEYSRGNLYSIIEKGQEALNGALELAQETETPRAYEVVGHIIKTVSDATEKLMELQKSLKEIEGPTVQKTPTTVNNALFVGSTAELSKLLKNQLNNK